MNYNGHVRRQARDTQTPDITPWEDQSTGNYLPTKIDDDNDDDGDGDVVWT